MSRPANSRMAILGTLLGLVYGLALSLLAYWAADAGHGTYIPLGVSSAPAGVLGVALAFLCTPPLWAILGGLAGGATQGSGIPVVRALVLVHYATAVLILAITHFGGEDGKLRYLLNGPLVIVLVWAVTYISGQVALWQRLGRRHDLQRTVSKPLLPAGAKVDLIRVSEAVWTREGSLGSNALSPAERVFLCVWNVEAEVNNGGFSQYFFNSAGDNAINTPAALREIGAARAAAIAEAANAVFGPSGPPQDRGARQEALEGLQSSATENLNALDAKFYEYPDNLDELLTSFVEHHREEFYAP